MAEIKTTSSMMYPLEAPNGWFLQEMKHHHERTSEKLYIPSSNRPWAVEFRRSATSDDKPNVAFGRGMTMEEAWASAKKVAESTGG